MACVERNKEYYEIAAERLEIQKRRCTACRENVKSAEKYKFQETMFPIRTDIPEESGTLTFRRSELMITELSGKQMSARNVSDPEK
jgi:ribosomal protein S27AE